MVHLQNVLRSILIFFVAVILLGNPAAAQHTTKEETPSCNMFGIGVSFHKQVKLSETQSSGTTLLLLHPQLVTNLNRKLAVVQEGVFGYSLLPRKNFIFGFNELLRFTPKPQYRLKPFIEVGAGISSFGLRLPELGSKMEFMLQAGAGIRGDIKSLPGWSWALMYRPTHFSNAGTSRPNHGINLHTVFIGITMPF